MIHQKFDPSQSYCYVRYRRYSNKAQNDRSIEQQDAEIDRTLKRLGYNWRCVGSYEDRGISGKKNLGRPGFMSMLRDISIGVVSVDLILIDTTDRLGRNDEMQSIRRDLKNRHGVFVLAASAGFIPATGIAGKAVEVLETAQAVAENEKKAHQVARGKLDLVMQKRWPGGPPPRGYRLKQLVEEGRRGLVMYSVLEPDPIWQPIIERMFLEADVKGLSGTAVTQALNKDENISADLKPFHYSTVARILRNPIYKGTFVYNKVSKDVVDDTNVTQQNCGDDVVVIEGFCPPIVAEDRWKRVQESADARGEAFKKLVANSAASVADKLIKPISGGIQLKWALSGLVICGVCDGRMVVAKSGRTSMAGTLYCYYRCTRSVDGACSNGFWVPAQELEAAVLVLLRTKLFPLESEGTVPAWFGPFVQRVERHLARIQAQMPSQAAADEAQLDQLRLQIEGWGQTLGMPKLAMSVREDITAKYECAALEIQAIEEKLQRTGAIESHVRKTLDPRDVLDRLKRLDEVMVGSNKALLNVELGKHLQAVTCFPDGSIKVTGTHVGVFDNLLELLTDSTPPRQTQMLPPSGIEPVKQRKLARRKVNSLVDKSCSPKDQQFSLQPARYDYLAAEFIWSEEVKVVGRQPGYKKRAVEIVAYMTANPKASKAAVARHFGVTPWFIRKALTYLRAFGASKAA